MNRLEQTLGGPVGTQEGFATDAWSPRMSDDATPFFIQLGHIKIKSGQGRTTKTVSDVFDYLDEGIKEAAFLFWKKVPIRLDYDRHLRKSFDSILATVWLATIEERFRAEMSLIADLVAVDIDVCLRDGIVRMRGSFRAEGEDCVLYRDTLARRAEIDVPRATFLAEWGMLLRQVVACLDAAGARTADGTERRKEELLRRVVARLDGVGALYTRSVR